jgi:hypothetical protein
MSIISISSNNVRASMEPDYHQSMPLPWPPLHPILPPPMHVLLLFSLLSLRKGAAARVIIL